MLEHLERASKIVSRDCSIRLPPVEGEDKMQQSLGGSPRKSDKGPRSWIRRVAGSNRRPAPERQIVPPTAERLSVHATLRTLPTLLDSSSLPNGVVELLIEDFEAPISQVFDIHDGRIALVEPGNAVPWTSIAGSATDWAMALGPERNLTALQLTGDKQLARRVLAAFPLPA
jgi:hypothetical protein